MTQKKKYEKRKRINRFKRGSSDVKDNMHAYVNFFSLVRKLKEIKRKSALFCGNTMDEVDTVADHCFLNAFFVWVLGGMKKDFDVFRALEIAFVHDLGKVFVGDSPHEKVFNKYKNSGKKMHEALKMCPVFAAREDREKFFKLKYEEEKKGLEKLLSPLDSHFKDEVLSLWIDYERGLSREARFVSQVGVLEKLVQAIEYREKNKKFPIEMWWVYAKESVDDPLLLDFLRVLEEKVRKIASAKCMKDLEKS